MSTIAGFKTKANNPTTVVNMRNNTAITLTTF